MNPDRRPILKLPVTAACTLLAMIAAIAGYQAFWTDSEMWSSVAVRHMFTDSPFYDFRIKPLFEIWLWISYQIARVLDVHPMLVARAISASMGLFGVVMFHRLATRISTQPVFAIGLTIALLGQSFLVKRYFSVRSDELVSVLFLAILLLGPGWRSAILMLATLFVTPKAALFCAAYALVFGRDFQKRWRVGAMAVASMIVGVLLWYASGRALPFFLDSLSNWTRFEHVLRLVGENPLLILIWLHNLYFGFAQRGALLERELKVYDLSNALLTVTLVFPDRLPFFLASLLPFWLLPIAASPLIERLCKPRVATLLLVYFSLSSLFWSAFMLRHHNSKHQRQYMSWLSSQDLQDLKIYDPVGVLPFHPGAENWWVGPSERGNPNVIATIRHQKPDLIVFPSRLLILGDELREVIERYYFADGMGLFMRQLNLPALDEGQVDDLRSALLEQFPRWALHPERNYWFRILGPERLDLSQYASWLKLSGERQNFANGAFSLRDLEQFRLLLPPKGAERMVVLPLILQTPYEYKWSEIFRFDPDI